MSIYKNQSAFDIVLDTSIDLSSADSVSVHYQKPSGTDGVWTGSVSETTKILYAVQAGDIDETGRWELQAVASFSGRLAYGRRTHMRVSNPITDL